MLSNYIHKYYFTEDKIMDWSTKRYTKFRKKYEIEYRYYDKNQLDTEEFNLKEQLEKGKCSDDIYCNIALACFAALLVIPQVLNEQDINNPLELGALKIGIIYIVYVGLFLLLMLRGIFTRVGMNKDKKYRLRLEILKKEKRYRKVKSKKIINLKKARSI